MRAISIFILLALTYPCTSQAESIEYSVDQNNRSFLSASEDYIQDLSDYLVCTQFHNEKGCDQYLAGSGCGAKNKTTPCTPTLMRRAYAEKLRYNLETHDYDSDLASERTRTVIFQAPVEFRTVAYVCELQLTLGSETYSTTASCSAILKLIVPYAINPASGRLEAQGTMALAIRAKDGLEVKRIEDTFYSQDILILALGDSFTAGEGNPLSNIDEAKHTPPLWIEPRCSRSVFSYPYIAATMLALAEKHHSVTVVNYACSGATTFEGLLGPYEGQLSRADVKKIYKKEIGDQFLRPQISQATAFLTSIPGRRPDYVLLSIGVNDVSVVDLLKALAGNWNLESELNSIEELRTECPTDKRLASIRISFDCLKERLATVHNEIDKLKPHNVFVLEYPNPLTRDSVDPRNGEPALCFSDKATQADDRELLKNYLNCRAGSVFGPVLQRLTEWEELTADEIAFAKNNFFAPLKQSIQDGLKTGIGAWTYLQTYEKLQRRGFCARKSHYHTFAESIQRTGAKPGGNCFSTGTLHPNVYGHYYTALSILAQLRSHVFKNDHFKGYGLHEMDKEQFQDSQNGFAWRIWNRRKITSQR